MPNIEKRTIVSASLDDYAWSSLKTQATLPRRRRCISSSNKAQKEVDIALQTRHESRRLLFILQTRRGIRWILYFKQGTKRGNCYTLDKARKGISYINVGTQTELLTKNRGYEWAFASPNRYIEVLNSYLWLTTNDTVIHNNSMF